MKITIEISEEQLAEIAAMLAPLLGPLVAGKNPGTYSVPEAAGVLGVAPITIRRRVEAGTIPQVPGIGRVRIPRQAIDRLVQ